MAIKDTVAQIRQEAGVTQEEMARRLYVTRQAVSRWETGETAPGIDMVKLICVTFGVPLERFFDMPQSYYCQCCSMPMPEPDLHGTEADGSPSQDFCRYCYDHGDFTATGVTMDEFIEATAPMEAEALGISRDEAVSLMATLLPHLKRWREVADNEKAYGEELRAAHGDEVIDAANKRYVGMGEAAHLRADELELAIKESCDAPWKRVTSMVPRPNSSCACTRRGFSCTGPRASTPPRRTGRSPTATWPMSDSSATTMPLPQELRAFCATPCTPGRDGARVGGGSRAGRRPRQNGTVLSWLGPGAYARRDRIIANVPVATAAAARAQSAATTDTEPSPVLASDSRSPSALSVEVELERIAPQSLQRPSSPQS